MPIQVKDFMSTPVTTAVGENSVKEIRSLMKDKGINAIPVVSNSTDGKHEETIIRGIITATDLSNELHNDETVEDVMTSSSVHVVHTDAVAQGAAKMMLKHNVHHLVAMDEGKIKGMVSAMDFVKLVAEHSLG